MELSRFGNTKMDFDLVEIDDEYVNELQEDALEMNMDGDVKIKTYNQKICTIIEGCPSVFKSDDLLKHYKCKTPKDLVRQLLPAGEQDFLYNEINTLNGFGDQKENKEKVKN